MRNNMVKRIAIVILTALILLCSYIYIVIVANGVYFSDFIDQKILGYKEDNGKMSKERDGVTFTIDNYVFDGYKLRVEYEISGEEDVEYKSYYPYLLESHVTINSEDKIIYQQEGIISDNKDLLKGYAIFYINSNYDPFSSYLGQSANDLINEYNIKLRFTKKFEDKNRSWQFDFKVASSELKSKVQEYKINSKIDDKLIKRIVKTPIGMYIEGDPNLEILIVDDKGRQYKNNKYCESIYNYEFEDCYYDEKIKWIKIVPFDSNETVYKEVELSLDAEKISFIQDNEMEIIGVDRVDGKTLINYKTKYPMFSTLVPIGNIKYQNNEINKDGTSTLILDEKLEDETYTFQYVSFKASYNIKKEKSIKIDF